VLQQSVVTTVGYDDLSRSLSTIVNLSGLKNHEILRLSAELDDVNFP